MCDFGKTTNFSFDTSNININVNQKQTAIFNQHENKNHPEKTNEKLNLKSSEKSNENEKRKEQENEKEKKENELKGEKEQEQEKEKDENGVLFYRSLSFLNNFALDTDFTINDKKGNLKTLKNLQKKREYNFKTNGASVQVQYHVNNFVTMTSILNWEDIKFFLTIDNRTLNFWFENDLKIKCVKWKTGCFYTRILPKDLQESLNVFRTFFYCELCKQFSRVSPQIDQLEFYFSRHKKKSLIIKISKQCLCRNCSSIQALEARLMKLEEFELISFENEDLNREKTQEKETHREQTTYREQPTHREHDFETIEQFLTRMRNSNLESNLNLENSEISNQNINLNHRKKFEPNDHFDQDLDLPS